MRSQSKKAGPANATGFPSCPKRRWPNEWFSFRSVRRRRQKCFPDASRLDGATDDFACFVDVLGLLESPRIARLLQGIQIGHHAILPDKSAAIDEVRVARNADHLAFLIDTVGLAVNVPG